MGRKEIRRQQGSGSDLPSRHWGVPPAPLAPVAFVSNGLSLANAAINFSSAIQESRLAAAFRCFACPLCLRHRVLWRPGGGLIW